MSLRSVIITATLILSSCTVPETISEYQSNSDYFLIDFSKYSNDGFFITPEAPYGSYQPIGLVSVTVNQGAKYVEKYLEKDEFDYPIYEEYWVKDSLNLQMAIDSLVQYSKSLGANSLASFKYDAQFTHNTASMYKRVALLSITVSGFAIKQSEPSSLN